MNVYSVMNTYNLNSLWNNLNSNNNSASTVPMINNIESSINENYTEMNYSGQTTSTELQDIYKLVEPSYGIPLTYNQNGTMFIPTSTTPLTDGLSNANSNIISLLNNGITSSDSSLLNILSQYNSIEDGTFKPVLSSILSSNPSTIYNTVNSLLNNQAQSLGNNIDSTV